MKSQTFNSFIARLVVLTMLVTQTSQVVALTLATKPLAATTTSAVRPNLMYVLDDSGSMGWDYTPDYVNDVTDSTGPSNGVADTLTAVRTGNAITSINFTANNTYTLGTPTVVIEGGGGTGASYTVTLDPVTKKISSLNKISGGSGYTSLPYVALIGGLPNVTWGMCWGTTGASNLGGSPKDTNVSPQCTSNSQPPYATAAINYQYYDPDIRYELPIKADGTRYLAPAPTNASSDGYLGGSSKNLTNSWTHEVWCNVSTAVPTAADPTAAGKCREVSDTSADNLFPNISFNFRKTYNGPATYFTMSPVEYCTDTNYTNCVRATTPQVVSGVTFNVPSYYRWCAYYNPLSHTFGACQGRRDSSHAIPNYLGGWVSTGAAGVQATANLVINPGPTAGQKLSNVTIGGLDVVNGTIFEIGQNFAYTAGTRAIGSATDVADAVCQTVRANTPSTGYSCAQAGAMVTLQASVVGTAPNGAAVLATGPATVGANSIGEIRILTATANLRVNTITIVRADASTASLISSPITATGSEANFAQAVCQAINAGPSQGTYIARSGDPADPGLAYGTCQSTLDAFVGIKRIPADTVDNGATISIVGPAVGSQSVGTISINATAGETRISDVTLAGVSVLSSKPLDYADGTLTAAIATDVASKISIAGCTATAAGNAISITGTCTGALAVVATGTAATGKFRVSTIGSGNPADLGGVQVNGTQIIGHVTNSTLTNGTAVSTNATSLRTQINNSTASQNTVGGVVVGNGAGGGHGFTASAPVLNGSSYDITVTAPVGNAYNNKSFTFQAGSAAAAGAGSSPIWTFPITGATADSKSITSITCGGVTAVPSRSTGVTNPNVNWVQNLADGFTGKTVAGPSGNYTFACSNASMASPQQRCIVTGPANAAACSPFTVTPTAGITVSVGGVGGLITSGSTSPQWTFNMSGATAEPKLINSLTCGGTAIFSGSASTLAGAAANHVPNLGAGLTAPAAWVNGYSYATIAGAGVGAQRIRVTGPTGSTVGQSFCNSPLSMTYDSATISLGAVAPSTGLAGASPGSLTTATAGTAATASWTTNISGATTDAKNITSIACGGVNQLTSNIGTGSPSTYIANLATGTNGLNGKTLNGYTYTCNAAGACSLTGPANTAAACNAAGLQSGFSLSNVTVGSFVQTNAGAAGGNASWTFDVTGGADGATVGPITCGSNILSPSPAKAGTYGWSRINNLATSLAANQQPGYSFSCGSALTSASSPVSRTCTLTGPGATSTGTFCSSALALTIDPAISMTTTGGAAVTTSLSPTTTGTAFSAGSPATYSITLNGATADSRAIHAFSCDSTCLWSDGSNNSPCTSSLNSSLTPDTGTTTAPVSYPTTLANALQANETSGGGWGNNIVCTPGATNVSCVVDRAAGDVNRCSGGAAGFTVTKSGGAAMIVGTPTESSTGTSPNKTYKYTFNITNVVNPNESITGIACASSGDVAMTSSATGTSASNIATAINSQSAANNGWNGTSNCGSSGSTVTCAFERNTGDTNRCTGGTPVSVTQTGMTVGAIAESSSGSSPNKKYTYTFTLSSVGSGDILTQVTCNGATPAGGLTASASTGPSSATDTQVVQRLNNLRAGLNAAATGGYSFSCGTATNASPSSACTVTGPIPSGAVPVCKFDTSSTISPTDPTLTNTGGTASAGAGSTWQFKLTGATTDAKLISSMTCGGANVVPASTVSTGSVASTAQWIADLTSGLNGKGVAPYTIATTGGATAPSQRFVITNTTAGVSGCTPTVTMAGGATNAGVTTVSNGVNSATPAWTFNITGASADNATINSATCNGVSTFGGTAPNSGSYSAARTAALATGMNTASKWNSGWSASCSAGTSPAQNCTVTGPASCTDTNLALTTDASSGIGITSGNRVLAGGTAPTWTFDILSSSTDNKTIGPITCGGTSALSGTANSGIGATLSVATRLNNLGDYMVSNPSAGWTIAKTSGAGASPVTMNLTGPLAKSGCAWSYTKDAEITASTPVQTAGTGPSTPQWQFDITNATADNLNFGTLTCGGTSLVPSPTPNTGTTPASFAYARINNLTGAVAGPPVVPGTVGPTNGYTMVCDAATATSPAPVCTLTGPQPTAMVPTACNAATLAITKDSTISVGTVGFTPGSTASSATDDFAPALTTVTAFGVARAAQGTSTSGIASVATGPVITSIVNMSNGALSLTGIPTNATGTPPDVLTMSGGLAADSSTNNWNGVGILKRVDIVPANNSYSRKSGRTDCLGATCTYAEEIQNFANWYTFYRTRMQMMKSATSLAFNQLDGNYRVGFDNICQATGTTVKKPLAQFIDSGEVAGQRTAWWSQLTSSAPSCATPLRAETAKIGRYYAGKLTTQTDPIQYSCQQNFTLLVTDGYWNENEPSGTGIPAGVDIGNTDNVLALAPRPYYDGAQASTTTVATGAARGSANSSFRTLADIAQYYYANDIRSSVKNVLVTTAAPHGLMPGQSVTISGVVSTPSVTDPTASYNGDFVVHVISANQFRFAPYSGTTGLLVDPGTYLSGGQVSANGAVVNVSTMSYTTGLFGNGTNSAAFDVSQDNVITSSDDLNQHQHVNFYAMGLGIDGTLDYRSDYQTATIGDFAEIRAGTRNWPAVANLDPTAVDDLWHATVNGHGKYFSARNLPNVVAGLREALTKIGARVGSAAAAATSNLQPVEGDNFAYVASYATLDWTGDLQSRSIDTLTGNVSSSTACTTPGSGCQWSAQAKLDALTWSARRIYIRPISNVSGDPLRSFSFATLTGAEQAWFSPSGLSQYATLILSNPGEMTAQNLVDFLRGNRSLEQDGSTNPQIWRFRAHVLGDIVNTQPEFLKAPNKSYNDAGYSAFKAAKAARKPVVFVSAQDGMLHAFNSDTGNVTVAAVSVAPGQEMWAYIPRQVMTSMKVLADSTYTNNHRYFVDGPIVVGDVNFGGGASDWHTILVGGQGAGGTSYFALDVTDPTNPIFLWEIDNNTPGFSNLGYTFSNPVLVKNPANGAWQVYFTSGYNNSDGQGYLFAVNPKTGAQIGSPIKTDEELSNATWAAGVVTFTLPGHNFSIGSNITITGATPVGYNGSYTVTAITADTFSAVKVANPGAYVSGGAAYDGRPRNLGKLSAWVEAAKTDNTAEYLYAGDLLGDLWRFDLYPGTAGHTGRAIFKLAHLETAGGIEQPITTKPQLTTAPNAAGSHLVFIGTGKYIENSDLTNTDVQGVYAIKDELSPTQRTWNPATDTVTVAGSPKPAFLFKKLIDKKTDGTPIQWVDEFGGTTPGRNICSGTSSTVSTTGTCNDTDSTAMDWDIYGGWAVSLPDSGERVNVDMKLTQGTLVFASNIPGATTCTIGGSAFVNFVDYSTGKSIDSDGKASRKVAGALVVGITVIKLASGETKVIVTKSDYKQETFKVPVTASSTFLGKRSLWREFEAY